MDIIHPSVFSRYPFDAFDDATVLRKALKRSDKNKIIEIITLRGMAQRQKIISIYGKKYDRDLMLDFISEFSGESQDLILAFMTPLSNFYAKEMHDALSGREINEDVIIEMFCTMSNIEIRKMSEIYEREYGNSLLQELRGETSGFVRDLCVSMVQGNRAVNNAVDRDAAVADAQTLFNSVDWNAPNSDFSQIFATRSYQQLSEIFKEYEVLSGNKIEVAISSQFSGSAQESFLTIVKVAKSVFEFFAEKLHNAIAGLGKNDKTIIRIFVSRSEIDLGDVETTFETKYKESLQSYIINNITGDYKNFLIAILGE